MIAFIDDHREVYGVERRWCTWWAEGEMTSAPSHYAVTG